MRKILFLLILFIQPALNSNAATGDTIHVQGFNHLLHQNCNVGDSTYLFPADSLSFYKIMLRYELSCPPGGCDIYDRIATLKVMKHTGVLDTAGNEILEPFEIARAITPYGEGVVLWFDVSDYSSLLHDSVELNSRVCGYSNGWHVTTDFYFIEGTPPMNAYKVVNLWNGTWQYGNTADPIDNHLQPITLNVDSQSIYEKVRLITTGHGFNCYPNPNVAEFYDVTHTLLINGVSRQQHLWRNDCGLNPLYPQGAPGYTSTWFYKRANWCPGSFVLPHDYNATALIGNSDTLRLDYNLIPYTVDSVPPGAYAPEYYIQSQVFFYDSLGYTNNAAILEIKKPNSAFEYNRINPICEAFSPEITIKNYGDSTLQQVSVHYGVDGSFGNTYLWTGNLTMGQIAQVILPSVTFGGGNHTFDVYLDQPNGASDEFAYDDTLHSSFVSTNIYNANFIVIALKPDDSPGECSWNVKDDAGTILFSRNSFPTPLQYHVDTLVLPDGCYTITVNDAFGDGVCCYNGLGRLQIFEGTNTTPLVNSGDYGQSYVMNLTLDFTSSVEEDPISNSIFVYPNPARDRITLNTSFENATVTVDVIDLLGKKAAAFENVEVAGHSTEIDLSSLVDGLYFIRVTNKDKVYVKRVVVD